MELNLLLLAIENKPTFILFYNYLLLWLMVMSPGQMLLTHFIFDVACIGQMLLCQSILFFICWLMMLKNLVGTRVSPALMLLGYVYYSYCYTVYSLFYF